MDSDEGSKVRGMLRLKSLTSFLLAHSIIIDYPLDELRAGLCAQTHLQTNIALGGFIDSHHIGKYIFMINIYT